MHGHRSRGVVEVLNGIFKIYMPRKGTGRKRQERRMALEKRVVRFGLELGNNSTWHASARNHQDERDEGETGLTCTTKLSTRSRWEI